MKKPPLTPGRLLWLLRYNHARGWRAAYYDYAVLPKILHWQPRDLPGRSDIELHMLTWKDDWLLAMWTVASFFHFTGFRWPVVMHEDGSVDEEVARNLERWLPDVSVIRRRDADEKMIAQLEAHPLCRELRAELPLMMKVLDFRALSKSRRIIILDCDILFFQEPREILEWVHRDSDDCWFNPDFQHASNISAEEAKLKWGIELWSFVNSGLCLMPSEVLSPDFCEEVVREGTITNQGLRWYIEQTLIQLCASRHGKGGLLPRTYEVSYSDRATDGVVARHYVGFVRQQFFSEGVARLAPVLFT